jgi:fructokinase
MSAGIRIGIDLGGTKIEGTAFGADGTEAARRRVPAPQGDYAASVAAITELVQRLDRDVGLEATVGIGMPGSLSPATGLVRNANSTWLNGQPLQRDIEARLGRPVRLANDANCFALSEAVDGAGAGARLVFGVILGTGCGGGIVHERRVVDGPLGVGGEWGHTPLPWAAADEHPGPRCWCRRYGCMETWVSGPAMAADHARATGASLTPEAIVAEAERGSSAAQATLDRHASRLARGLAGIVNVLDPDVIVLGGGLSQLGHLYVRLPELIAPHIFSDHVAVTIRPPRWGDAGGVRGAAWLWGR